MKENKKISVIIIANNNTEECLENIFKQSYINDIETVVFYKTKEIEKNQKHKQDIQNEEKEHNEKQKEINAIEENKENQTEISAIKEKYKTTKFVMFENNIFKAINENLKLINGDYISILNSEDNMTIDYYRTMTTLAEDENADIVMSNAVLEYSDGGKAYLNLSEASLKNLEDKNILKEYIKQSGLSFLWSIYGNKIYKRELFEETLKEICKKEEEIQNFYFFTIMFYYAKKLRLVNNEVLFYNFEEEILESVRNFTKCNGIKEELKEITSKNFIYVEAFLKEKNLDESIENWKNRYLIEDIELKKDILTKTKTAWNDNLEKLKKEIIDEKTQVVSFDIFDTLIMRPFWSPIDLFTFLNKYFREINKTETGIDFSKIRVEAEKVARQNLAKNNDKREDITLDEIYQEIQNVINVDNDIIEKMKNKEQELEIRFCTTRKVAKEIYELAKYLGKKVICISDMYLPIETIEKMINKNGYYVEKIYLSSEIGLTKFHKDLYDYVAKDLKIEPSKIVHIGDNYFSDYENAIKSGINAQFLPKAVDVFCDENITNALGSLFKTNLPMWENNSNGLNFIGIRCMLALVANSYFDNPYRTFNNETDFNADCNLIGYYALGMHLFGIAKWLLQNAKKEGYEKIVFFARDGYWTLKAYQILEKLYKDSPKTEYLYISRRALIPVTLNNKFDFYKLSELIDIYKYTPKTVLKYIKDILFNLENLEAECNKAKIDINKKFENKTEFNRYMNLIIDKFYDKNKHSEITKKLEVYFSKIFEGKACAFDIGYSAKPEMYLSKLCKKKIDTYFVNISNEEAYEHSKIGGFKLYSYFDYRPTITGVVRESLMSTSDPSCIGYEFDEKGNVVPVFEEETYDYQNRFIFDSMQDKALEFVSNLVNIFGNDLEYLYYQRYYISLPHEMYINSAKRLDQEIFYGIDFEDAVGLGDKITAVQEWNSEMKEKNQKRTGELFYINYTKDLKKEISKLKEKLDLTQNEKKELLDTCKKREEEINQIYNSKRWKYINKIDKFLGRKN